jgi:hypothetical protein
MHEAFTSPLKLEAARPSETVVSNHHTTRRNNPEKETVNSISSIKLKKILFGVFNKVFQ